jgi:hypothetical protein
MLGICTAPACTAIVFGDGTCVAHDQPRPHPADMALGNAVSRGQVPLTVEARQPAAIES